MKLVTLILIFCFFGFGLASSKEWRDPVTGMQFVWVPGGSFQMGCHANAGQCYQEERPVRIVRLDSFWIGKTEVTQGQWKHIMGNNPSWFKKGDNYPVEKVSWNDVQEFIRRLNRQSSAKYRLPSEAQWEYACRAGGKSVTYGTGNGRLSSGNANFGKNNGGTTPVGRYQANALGLNDMSGNVWEWVQGKYKYGKVGANRMRRGGGWVFPSRLLRCTNRVLSTSSNRSSNLGFRLLRIGEREKQRLARREEHRLKNEIQERKLAEEHRQAAIRQDTGSPTWRDPVTGMRFVKVPGGSFQMGCYRNAVNCRTNEKPARTVRLDGFWIGKYEVTQGQWKRIMGSNPSRFKKGDYYPVERVSWNDVQKFIQKLNQQSSSKFRLLSEAQWEYACRARGKPVNFSWGNSTPGSKGRKQANLADMNTRYSWRLKNYDDGNAETALVGSYPPNPLGLHDMSGNVLEWVQDKFTKYGNIGTNNPINERSGFGRVFRGGSFSDALGYLRCSNRPNFPPSIRSSRLGFRLLRVK